MSEPVLTCNNIVAGYVRDLPILHGVSITLERASLTVIIGPNGAGKSTLIKSIAGLVSVTSGSITMDQKEITSIRPDEMHLNGISYVPQTDNIFRTLSIRQNLELSLRNGGMLKSGLLQEIFERFPALKDKQNEKAGTLSGGQRQMLAIAMALSFKPSIILMDEPSAGLSPKVAEEVLVLAKGLTEAGVSILLVEQNVKQALALADYCYILAEGRNQIDGPASQLLHDPVVGEIYLGGKRMEAG